MPPANDNLANRTVLSDASGSVTVSNVGATEEVGEYTASDKTIWFEWTAGPGVDTVIFDTLTSAGSEDTVLQAWPDSVGGYPLTFGDRIGYDDDSGTAAFSKMKVPVSPGDTIWVSLGTFGEEGTFVLRWASSFEGQPASEGGTGSTRFIAIGDMDAHTLTGWSAAVVSMVNGAVSLGPLAELPIGTTPGPGQFIQGKPVIGRISANRAAFCDAIFLGSGVGVDVYLRLLDIDGDTIVVGPRQLLHHTDYGPYSVNTVLVPTSHPVSGAGQFIIVATRVTDPPVNTYCRLTCYRIEDDLSFTEVDNIVEDFRAGDWLYQLEDGTVAHVYLAPFSYQVRIITIGTDGTMSFGSSVEVHYPDEDNGAGGFNSGVPTVVPGTRKVLATSDLFDTDYPEIDPGGEDLGVWLVDIDTGAHGAVSRFFAGSFVPYGISATLAGRSGSTGTWGLLTAPSYDDDDLQRIWIRPFAIDGNDMVFDGTHRTVMSQSVDVVNNVDTDSDYGFFYQYDNGLFVAFHSEYNDYPFARMIASPIGAHSGSGYESIFDFDDDDTDDRNHYFYSFESMPSAPPVPNLRSSTHPARLRWSAPH